MRPACPGPGYVGTHRDMVTVQRGPPACRRADLSVGWLPWSPFLRGHGASARGNRLDQTQQLLALVVAACVGYSRRWRSSAAATRPGKPPHESCSRPRPRARRYVRSPAWAISRQTTAASAAGPRCLVEARPSWPTGVTVNPRPRLLQWSNGASGGWSMALTGEQDDRGPTLVKVSAGKSSPTNLAAVVIVGEVSLIAFVIVMDVVFRASNLGTYLAAVGVATFIGGRVGGLRGVGQWVSAAILIVLVSIALATLRSSRWLARSEGRSGQPVRADQAPLWGRCPPVCRRPDRRRGRSRPSGRSSDRRRS